MHAFLLFCLLGFVAAQVPVPCKTPQQWQARIFEVNEQQEFMVRARLTYDAVYRRERILDEVDVGREQNYYEVIALFDAQVEYVYDFKARNCTRRPLTRAWRDFGIQPDARPLGEAYIGTSALPSASILCTIWGRNFTGPANDTVQSYGTWTYQACLPVRVVAQSSKIGRTQVSFYDIVAGIPDPSVFIPRQECLTAEEYAMRDELFGKTPKKIQK